MLNNTDDALRFNNTVTQTAERKQGTCLFSVIAQHDYKLFIYRGFLKVVRETGWTTMPASAYLTSGWRINQSASPQKLEKSGKVISHILYFYVISSCLGYR